VKIYMLLIDDERFFFFADESELAHEEGEDNSSSARPRSGIRKWLHDRLAKFKSAWQDAGSGALYWMRRVWDWLHSFVRPDEAMLARLRSVRRINLHHPAVRNKVDVHAHWQNYLIRQRRRHLFWLGFNAVIAPISVILAILPGPNLIGYWFAYRAVHHTFVVWGITRVRRNLIPTELHSLASLDVPIEQDDDGKARHTACNAAGEGLEKHVAWWRGSFFGMPRAGRASAPAAPAEPAHVITGPENPETGDHAPPEL
jgi:hypothetical protein